jgi:hypothetical protein
MQTNYSASLWTFKPGYIFYWDNFGWKLYGSSTFHIHFHCSERNTISYILATTSSNNCVSFVMTYDYFPNTNVINRVHVLPIYTHRNLVTEVRVWACCNFPNTDITARVHVLPTYTDRNLVTEVRVWHAVTSPTRTSRLRYTFYLLIPTDISWEVRLCACSY